VAVANDLLAVGCYAALDDAGLRCPDDLSLVGFNDMPFVDRLRPPLSTVRFPHYQLGTEAAQLLLERVSGRESPVKILYLAPELMVRGSTAPPDVRTDNGASSRPGRPVPLRRPPGRAAGGPTAS
jgi:LacI family transcriptional regulator